MTLRITLFDHLTVADDAGVPRGLRSRAQRLLAYLVLHRNQSLAREQVAFALWPDHSEREALALLRRALNDLRGATDATGASQPVIGRRDTLRWDAGAARWADVLEFERLVRAGTPSALHEAVALYGGDLLKDWDDEWVVVERERLRQLQLDALRRLVAHHRALGEGETALRLCRQAIGLDPFVEAVHREQIALHYEAGDRAAALAAYDRLRALLDDELGIEPMPETQALRAAIVAGTPLPMEPTDLPGAAASALAAAPPPIGRDVELERLVALWDLAAGGRGRLAIISGEAGVGKSHLARVLADEALRRGGLTLVGHCYDFEAALPYQPIVEMLRSVSSLLRHVDLAHAHHVALARLVPDVLGLVGSPDQPAGLHASELRVQLFEALLQAFRALASGQPLLLLLEDLHWADASTLDWLTYVTPRLGDSRLLLAITYRTEEVDTEHAVIRLRRRLEREGGVATVLLAPLSREANRLLVAQLSGLAIEQVGPIADRLFDETAGNPFFLREIIRGLIDAGLLGVSDERWLIADVERLVGQRLPVPDSVRETIAIRLERLTERTRTFIQLAAVQGRVFDYDVVRRVGGWDDEQALAAIEDALARGFVGQREDQSAFAFVHHLVQDAIYANLTQPRRVYWHRRLAETLAEVASNLPDEQRRAAAGQITRHAVRGEQHALVFDWAPLAAAHAQALYAYGDALQQLETASAALDRLREAAGIDAATEQRHIDVLLLRSELMPHVGRSHDEHGRVLQAAADLLARFPDERRQVTLDLRRCDYLADQRQYVLAAEAALRASERCLALGDRRGAARGLYQAGNCWITIGRNRDAIGVFDQALELFESAGSVTGVVMCLSGIGWIHVNLGAIDAALPPLSRALELSEERGDMMGMARTCFVLAATWCFYYHAEHTRRFAERSEQLYREIGYAWTALRPRMFIAVADMLEGKLARAEREIDRVTDGAHEIQDSWLEGWGAQLVGRLALLRGDLAPAERRLERAYQLRRESGEVSNQVSDLAWLGRLRLAQGRADSALEHTSQAVSQLESRWGEFWAWETPDVFLAHAEALYANGDAAGARLHVQRAYEHLTQFAARISDADVRQTFVSYSTNARIAAAWESGCIPPLS